MAPRNEADSSGTGLSPVNGEMVCATEEIHCRRGRKDGWMNHKERRDIKGKKGSSWRYSNRGVVMSIIDVMSGRQAER